MELVTDTVFEVLTDDDAVRRVLAALGLVGSCTRLDEPAALAALVRRAASLSCPCPPDTLRRRVLTGLRGLVEDEQAVGHVLDELIDAVTAYGDLIEARVAEGPRLHLYLASPGFVRTSSDKMLLLGIAPDGADMVPAGIAVRIERNGYANILRTARDEDLPAVLKSLGLQEIHEDTWFKRPTAETAVHLKQRHDAKLDHSANVGSIDELEVIDPVKSLHFYNGRWVKPGKLSGRFVARRPQAYGAPLWCYVELSDGVPTGLLDLHASEWRGCDQAWYLQMALDAVAGHPQQFDAELTEAGTVVLRFFGPVPSWWQRRWDVIAARIASKGCLFAYEMSYDQYEAELRRLKDELWLTERN